MNMLFFFLIVGGIFYYLTRGFLQNPSSNSINLSQKETLNSDIREHEAGLIIALMAKVAKADGRVSELEAELIKHSLDDISNAFENNTFVRAELKKIYSKEKEYFENTLAIARKYYKLTKNEYDKRLSLLEFLLNLSFIDGDYSSREQMITEDISKQLRVSQEDFKKLIKQFEDYYAQRKQSFGMDLATAYKTLGADENEDFASIKKKYRSLVKKNHPDILMGQGASQNIIDRATKKLQTINEAYEKIKKEKG